MYNLLKIVVRFIAESFFGRITIIDQQNFPAKGPVIIVANHQNALMDPVVICCFSERPIHWFTRADLFRKPFINRLLRRLHMMPIYRSRDKVNLAEATTKTNSLAIEKLRSGSVIAIFPEGTHLHNKYLRPFKKGLARLISENHCPSELRILPVAIDYSQYDNPRTNLVIQFGSPFAMNGKNFKESSPGQILTEITDECYRQLRELVIHITDDRIEQKIDELRFILVPENIEMNNFRDEYFSFRKISAAISEKCRTDEKFKTQFISILDNVLNFRKSHHITKTYDIRRIERQMVGRKSGLQWMRRDDRHNVPGTICHIISKKLIKDHHFYTSVFFVAAIFVYPIFWILIVTMIICIPVSIMPVILIMVILEIFSWQYYSLNSVKTYDSLIRSIRDMITNLPG